MIRTTLKIVFAIQLILFSMFQVNATGLPEAKPDEKIAAVKQKLAAAPGIATVYVKGLCRPSCAIGIRKKISKLDFVDKKRFVKGVELDTKTQLASIAVTEGQSINIILLTQAIRDAGYDPANLHTLDSGKVKSLSLVMP